MARDFNGSTDKAQPSSPPFTAAPFTVSGWFNHGSSQTGTIFSVSDGTTGNHFFNMRVTAGTPDVLTFNAVEGGQDSLSGSTEVTTGAWHHAAFVARAANDREIYLDGASEGTSSVSKAPTGIDQGAVGVLLWDAGPVNYFDGLLAEIAIWNVGLSNGEIAALSKGFSPLLIRSQSLIFYAPLIGRLSPEPSVVNPNFNLTLTGTSRADHPRIIYPSRPVYGVPAAVVGGGIDVAAAAGALGLAGLAPAVATGALLAAPPGGLDLAAVAPSIAASQGTQPRPAAGSMLLSVNKLMNR